MDPRSSQRLGLAAILLAATFAMYWLTRPGTPAPSTDSPPTADSTPAPSPVAPSAQRPLSQNPIAQPPPEASNESRTSARPAVGTAGNGNQRSAPPAPVDPSSSQAMRTEVEDVGLMVRDFRNTVGENPVGTNAEITSALLGDNAKQVRLQIPSGSHLNEKRELVDRWGTPYFFHQLSGDEMEVRSAGPDQQMWTGDDIKAQ